MRNLTTNEIYNISGGAYAFCAITPFGELLCTKVIWNGFENVQIGKAEILPITYVNGAATFFV